MDFEIKAQQKTYAGKGPGVIMYGSYVTEHVHQAMMRLMCANNIRTEEYIARHKCHAFFQGGSNDPKGEYIFIEFWNHDLDASRDFMRLLNKALHPHIGCYAQTIPINPYKTEGSISYAVMIAEDTGCPYDGGVWNGPFTFRPESNIQHAKVMDLVRYIGLHVLEGYGDQLCHKGKTK